MANQNVKFTKRYGYIDYPTLTNAIIDRLISNANKIELNGESMRQKRKKIVNFATNSANLMFWNRFLRNYGTNYSVTMEPKQTLL